MQNIETENYEEKIPYKYKNVNDIQTKSYEGGSNLKVSESGSDLFNKINEEADNLGTFIDNDKLKIFSKYEDLNMNQLEELLNEKNQNITDLNSQKEKAKNDLNSLLQKINKIITDNADLLYNNEINFELIENLKNELNNRKNELKKAKNINNICKSQYNYIHLKYNKKNENNKEDKEVQVIKMRKENKKLQLDINKFKDENLSHKLELKKINNNTTFPNIIKSKVQAINNLSSYKFDYIKKIKIEKKSLGNVIKELSYIEDLYKKNKDKNDESLNNKIEFWINLIKSDLKGSENEIISRILKDESVFLKEINKQEVKPVKNDYNTNHTENNINVNNRYNSSSAGKENNKVEINIKQNLIKSKNSNPKQNIWKYKYLQNSSYQKKRKPKIQTSIEASINKLYRSPNSDRDMNNETALKKDYNETKDNEYMELLTKKSQYLETNVRLEQNIKSIERTKKSKILSTINTVEENGKKLNELKLQNSLLEKELDCLQNLYKLTVDKVKIKNQMKSDNNKDKEEIKEKPIETPIQNGNNINNEIKEDKISKNENKIIKNQEELREEKIEKIKKKYLNDFNIDNISEIPVNNLDLENKDK